MGLPWQCTKRSPDIRAPEGPACSVSLVWVETSARVTGPLRSKKGPSFGTDSKSRADGHRAEAGLLRDGEAQGILDTAKETPVEGDMVPVGSDARNRLS